MKRFLKGAAAFLAVFLVLSGCFFLYRTLTMRLEENRVNRQNQQLQQQYEQDLSAETDDGDDGIRERFRSLYEQNDDLVGWLTLPDLSVPVLQYTDNAYYLAHDFYGNQDVHGSVFLDHRNEIDPRDENLVLYGHNRYAPNLRDTTMFYALTHYRELAYLQEHPTFEFDTLFADGNYVIYAVFLADTDSARGDVFAYHNVHSFTGDAQREAFLDGVRARSLWLSDVEIAGDDELLMLSTCDYDFSGERLVVAARRLRDGESAAQAVGGGYEKNPDPLMPQAWTQLYGSSQ